MSIRKGDSIIAGMPNDVVNSKADVSLSNLDYLGKNISTWSTNVTNCITEIPQDIKLELNNGTLTLKAGSKIYVPNGVGIFDEITISSDLTKTGTGNSVAFLVYDTTINALRLRYINESYSGPTTPTSSTNEHWYDTTNNRIGVSGDSGSTWTYGCSLPLAVISQTSSVITSIDQVFNGFGYIGSTIFALPGIKGLIPDGRNADGSLKNIFVTFSVVRTMTMADWMPNRRNTTLNIFSNASIGGMDVSQDNWGSVLKLSDLPRGSYYGCWYCEEDNLMHYFDNSANEGITTRMFVGSFDVDSNNKITSLTTKTPFHVVDYNDTEYIGNQAMPSKKHISLTVGTSGTAYTMPANGYLLMSATSTATNQNIQLSGVLNCRVYSSAASQGWRICIPVSKGESVTANYTMGSIGLIFVYAQGAQ